DFIPYAYILEVSSPGLGRPLKNERHLEKSLGEAVEIKTYKPIDGRKEFEGVLKAYDAETVTIEVPKADGDGNSADEPGKERILNRKEIALIRLALDF
ncbi:MAG: ribosome maturation factor RimP, partial [Lachnospiraceae bacterium]|nr:ribosome maturation factor RimP [Lachnospiraceae bacterium]